MGEKIISINVNIDNNAYEDLIGYAKASGLSVEVFASSLIYGFLRLQNTELEEIHINDDGTTWLFPTDE
ncbi:MAG: hypothetical protein ACI4F5_04610 [Acutalibacteraceae bacterium]